MSPVPIGSRTRGISGAESVGIIRILQSVEDPPQEVLQAILFALEWLEEVRLPDGRWARFYEIGTNVPFSSDGTGSSATTSPKIDLNIVGLCLVWYMG